MLFVVGIALVLLEIFVFPGHGIFLTVGIVLAVCGLALALVRNIDFDFTFVPKGALAYSFLMVTVAMAVPLILIVAFGKTLFDSRIFHRMSDVGVMKKAEGFSVRDNSIQDVAGLTGTSVTNLRPVG